MGLPSRTWTIDPNNIFTDQNDQLKQFQEACFALKQVFVAAGWTVRSSSNGTTADTSDNWATSADVVTGLAGSGSWIVFRSPVGWIPSSEQIDLIFYVNDNAAPFQQAPIRICPSGYNTDGTTAALPTPIGSETTVLTSPNFNIIPWTVKTSGRWNSWYTSKGDVMFGVKQAGRRFFQHFMFLSGNVDGDGGGKGAQRWVYGARTSSTTDALVNPYSGINWRSSRIDKTAVNSQLILTSDGQSVTSWLDGFDYKGETKILEAHHFITQAANGRHLGELMGGDVGIAISNAAATATPFGTLDDPEDTQTLRRVCISGFWVYFLDADLPIQ